jgi:hypothetical protein
LALIHPLPSGRLLRSFMMRRGCWPDHLPSSCSLGWCHLRSAAATVFASLTSKLAATISLAFTSKPAVGFLVEPQNQSGGGFLGLGLKISSSGLVIWALKSPRRFLCLGLKTKQGSICRLRHKTDGGRLARDTCRDLAACLAWEQVVTP